MPLPPPTSSPASNGLFAVGTCAVASSAATRWKFLCYPVQEPSGTPAWPTRVTCSIECRSGTLARLTCSTKRLGLGVRAQMEANRLKEHPREVRRAAAQRWWCWFMPAGTRSWSGDVFKYLQKPLDYHENR
jgi:hypothetical protein